MKRILTGLLLLVMACHAMGQDAPTSVASSPGFAAYMRRNIRFLAAAQRQKSEGRLYLYVDIDSLGKVVNADVRNPNRVDTLLANEVYKVGQTIPTQNPAYEGRYVLPIVFAYTLTPEPYASKVTNRQETRLLKSSRARKLLNEVVLESYGPSCVKRSLP
jgi:hypothetical protein